VTLLSVYSVALTNVTTVLVVAPLYSLVNQKWLSDHPVEWEEGQYPSAAPDGSWIRVLPVNGTDRFQDKIQVWGVVGFESFSQSTGPETPDNVETVPKYGWLDLAATDAETSGSTSLPDPNGQNGKTLVVHNNLYVLTNDILIPTGDEEPITLNRNVEVNGGIQADDSGEFGGFVSAAEGLRIIGETGAVAIGEYDADRTGNKHPSDWMWEMIRKEPTDRSIEYFPDSNAYCCIL